MKTLIVMEIKKECAQRNIDKKCDRNCESCDLRLPDKDIMAAYDNVIQMLKRQDDDLK